MSDVDAFDRWLQKITKQTALKRAVALQHEEADTVTVEVDALKDVKVGDTVKRSLAGVATMNLEVTVVGPEIIACGDWIFDRRTGMEIDEELGWGPAHGITGSYIVPGGSHD
jgi:hypothetical protein